MQAMKNVSAGFQTFSWTWISRALCQCILTYVYIFGGHIKLYAPIGKGAIFTLGAMQSAPKSNLSRFLTIVLLNMTTTSYSIYQDLDK